MAAPPVQFQLTTRMKTHGFASIDYLPKAHLDNLPVWRDPSWWGRRWRSRTFRSTPSVSRWKSANWARRRRASPGRGHSNCWACCDPTILNGCRSWARGMGARRGGRWCRCLHPLRCCGSKSVSIRWCHRLAGVQTLFGEVVSIR